MNNLVQYVGMSMPLQAALVALAVMLVVGGALVGAEPRGAAAAAVAVVGGTALVTLGGVLGTVAYLMW